MQKRIGNQKPTFRVCPAYTKTGGDECGELARAYGLPPDEWQQLIFDDWLAIGDDSLYVASVCGLCVPRQSGKNYILERRELYGICVLGEQMLHTAHEVRTARKAFDRLCSYFEDDKNYPELAKMVKVIRKANGQERITLINGGAIEFSARSRGAARGYTVDVVIMDEAQELTDEQAEALNPTLSAAPLGNRQIIYVGTPPPPGSPGTVFERIRKSAHSEKPGKLAWAEWSVEEIGDVLDKERWYLTNPALGIRIDEGFIDDDVHSMSKDGFAREHLGWWSEIETKKKLISAADWSLWESDKKLYWDDGAVSIGIKFSIDGNTYSLCVAVKTADFTYIEVPANLHGTITGIAPLANWLISNESRICNIAIDGKGTLGTLVDAIKEEIPANKILIPKAMQVASCANSLLDGLRSGTIKHSGQELFNSTAPFLIKRPFGNTGAWGFGGAVDTTPIEAASLAVLASRNAKVDEDYKFYVAMW